MQTRKKLRELSDQLAHSAIHGPIPLPWQEELEPLVQKIKEQEEDFQSRAGDSSLRAREKFMQKVCYVAFGALAPAGVWMCYIWWHTRDIMRSAGGDSATTWMILYCGLAVVSVSLVGLRATKKGSARGLFLVLAGVVALYMAVVALGAAAYLMAHDMTAPFRTIAKRTFDTPAKRSGIWHSDVCPTLSRTACSDHFLHFPIFSAVSATSLELLFSNCTVAHEMFASNRTASAAQALCQTCVEDCQSKVASELGDFAAPVIYAAWVIVVFTVATVVFNFCFLLMAQAGPKFEETELFVELPKLQKRIKEMSSDAGIPLFGGVNPLVRDQVDEDEVHLTIQQYQDLMRIFQQTINAHVYVEIPWLVKKVGRILHITLALSGLVLSVVSTGVERLIKYQCAENIDCEGIAEVDHVTMATSWLFHVGWIMLLSGCLMYYYIMHHGRRDLKRGKGLEQTTELFIRITSAGGFVLVFAVLFVAMALTIGLSEMLARPSITDAHWPALRQHYESLDSVNEEFRCAISDSDDDCLEKMENQFQDLMEKVDVYLLGFACALLVLMWIIVALMLAIERVEGEDDVENWHPLDWCFIICIDGYGPGGSGHSQRKTLEAEPVELAQD
eukprot:COSAG01_NODE_10_length_42970_cov_93.010007_7_plen_616_part_00